MEVSRLEFSELDVEALKTYLGAWLDTYRGRSASDESEIDTLQLSKADKCSDLANVQVFKDYTADFETASADLKFADDSVGEVHIRVSRVNGSVWVVGNAPEGVIDRVFAAVKSVKGLG